MAASTNSDQEFVEELDWLKIKAELDHEKNTPVGRLSNLITSNPFVPIGKFKFLQN